ncbi:hypothetical protein L207DRAFT_600395 [Hyaloscypha variabilis F]|jgi:hypothetical protein|uniref:Protein kinase domain-containing protein n=1 Tax=Hyaloscypha variabilis (strain UAMH 11265 / GT02V1 / F) TaxID=1149755 RepID=A0A2J6RGY6_HYAVF|nr:hypothetical protein L207DRAFT_600395 [Hyaloscypha variabilis F]
MAILLEGLDQTLTQHVSTPDFQQLDKVKFIGALESAVDYLHSLGLAHNDINHQTTSWLKTECQC